MYPVFRVGAAMARAAWLPRMDPWDEHVIRTRCWPWDIDFMAELNNGRVLTLLDIGRLSFAVRMGLVAALRRRGWGLAIAGATAQYRRRVKPFEPIEIRTRAIGRDARFIYLDQVMTVRAAAAHQVVYRAAVTSRDGIVPTDEVAREIGMVGAEPALPDWVRAWAAAETGRPWPPAP